jgi:predicted amino acid dehydrogenase
MAERLGARLLGLGAYTSVVGLTVAMALRAVREGGRRLGIVPERACAAVVGASGTIGAACAELLAREVRQLILIGRRPDALAAVAGRARAAGHATVELATELSALRQAQLVVTVTSALDQVIAPEHLRTGAVVCDVARPRDVSRRVVEQRPDVLVIEGGMVAVPGQVDFGFDFGFPPGMAYACMAETIALALDQRYEPFTLGKQIRTAQVEEIDRLAERHGFRLGGLRSFERAVTDEQIDRVRARVALRGAEG